MSCIIKIHIKQDKRNLQFFLKWRVHGELTDCKHGEFTYYRQKQSTSGVATVCSCTFMKPCILNPQSPYWVCTTQNSFTRWPRMLLKHQDSISLTASSTHHTPIHISKSHISLYSPWIVLLYDWMFGPLFLASSHHHHFLGNNSPTYLALPPSTSVLTLRSMSTCLQCASRLARAPPTYSRREGVISNAYKAARVRF